MKLSTIFPILGILLFIYIILNIGLERITIAFLAIQPGLFLISLLFFIPRMILYSYKWHYLCKLQKMYLKLNDVIIIFLISLFYGSITPGGIGYYIRIFYLQKKCKTTIEKSITNSLIDSTTGFIGGLLLSLLGSFLIIKQFPALFPSFLIAVLFYLTTFSFFLKKERSNKLVDLLIKPFIPQKYKTKLDQSLDSLYQDIPSLSKMPLVIVYELFIWVLGALQVWIIALSFSLHIPFHIFLLMSIISATVGALPITIGGLGVREGIFVVLLAAYGVPSETAFVIALSGFLVKKLLPGLIGLPLSFKYHIKPELT